MGADNSMWLSGQAVYKKSKVNLTPPFKKMNTEVLTSVLIWSSSSIGRVPHL